MDGHWSCTCCTAKHPIDLYQESIKEKEKNVKMDFVYDSFEHNSFDPLYLDVTNFFEHPEGRIC